MLDYIAEWIISLSWRDIIGIIFLFIFVLIVFFEVFMHEVGE